MTLSLYDASIPVYLRMLRNLKGFLAKAEAYAAEQGRDLEELAQARLAPDMLNLIGQVQRASDAAKGGSARLAGREPPSFADEETTYAQLAGRLDKTIAFVETVTREEVAGAEDRTIELKLPNNTMTFNGVSFLLGFSLPNFLFHVTTAYAILRKEGAPLGKLDYLAS